MLAELVGRGPHDVATWIEIGLAVVTFVSLFFITAPYGRHARPGWGPTVEQRLGWVLMECPAVFAFTIFYAMGEHRAEPVPIALFALWQLHYVHRTFVFPARLPARKKRTPVFIVGSAVGFNLLNAYVNGLAVSQHLGVASSAEGFADPRFIAGVALFAVGFAGNFLADERLRKLRKTGEGGYSIPRGGAFELVSAPNYMFEILEWTGWAIATWTLGGAAFALYTFANLAPRAASNHAWYRANFPDYPKRRRALVPFLW